MSNYSKIYWLTRLDYLQGIFLWASIIIGIIILARCFIYIINNIENNEFAPMIFKSKSAGAFLWVWFFISILIASLIPTKNEAILIMAGGKTLDYVQKDTSLSKVPYQTTAIISEYLDKTLKEMKSDKK